VSYSIFLPLEISSFQSALFELGCKVLISLTAELKSEREGDCVFFFWNLLMCERRERSKGRSNDDMVVSRLQRVAYCMVATKFIISSSLLNNDEKLFLITSVFCLLTSWASRPFPALTRQQNWCTFSTSFLPVSTDYHRLVSEFIYLFSHLKRKFN